jgi:outer membrane protein TolC
MRAFAGLSIALLLSTPAAAQPATHISLEDVVHEALARNPEITAAQQRYEAARQRPNQEHSLPDPMVSAGYNSSGNPLPVAGLGVEPTANIGFMVTQTIPYSGKRDLRVAMASRDASAELQQIDAARLSVVARVKQAYYALAYTYAVGDVLTHNRELLDTLLKVSEGRYAVGRAAQQDVIKAQTQLSVLELQAERIAQQRATRAGALNALMDRPASAPVGRPDDLSLVPFEYSLDALVGSASLHAPMLQKDRIMIDRSQIAVSAAQKEYKPDFSLSGGYFYMGAMPSMYEFRVDFSLPLRSERRAAAVAEQLSSLAAARSTYQGTRLSLQSRLQEDYQMAATSAKLAGLYRDTVLPQARLALESSMTAYQTGAIDFLSVLTSFGSVLEYEMTYFEELVTFHAAVSRLEEMTGAPLAH